MGKRGFLQNKQKNPEILRAFVLNLPPGTYANSLTYNRSVPPP